MKKYLSIFILLSIFSNLATARQRNEMKICGYPKGAQVQLTKSPFIWYPRHIVEVDETFLLKEIGVRMDGTPPLMAIVENQKGQLFLIDETNIRSPSGVDFAQKLNSHDCAVPEDSRLENYLKEAVSFPDNEVPTFTCRTTSFEVQLEERAITEINASFPDAPKLTSRCSLTLLQKEMSQKTAAQNGAGGTNFTSKSLLGNFVLRDCNHRIRIVKSGNLSEKSRRDVLAHSFQCEKTTIDTKDVSSEPFKANPDPKQKPTVK
jgi:hypothetical protein